MGTVLDPRSRSRSVAGAVITAAVAAVALAGCSSAPPQSTVSATPTTMSSAATSAASSLGPSVAAEPSSQEPSGAPFGTAPTTSPGAPELANGGVGAAARVGRHTGFDRVVYEFTGPEAPRFWVSYVDEAIGDPNGETRDIPGEAILEVRAYGVGYPEAGQPTPEPVPPATLEGTVISFVEPISWGFEAVAQQFIGIRGGQRPFRVTTLTNPSRIVIDVATTKP